jgi:thiamine biosynthesis protein ThiI
MKKAVCLLSGGIDSPVAAALLLKQGIEVVLVHFQNLTRQQDSVQNKIERLTEQLSKLGKVKLYVIPFKDTQFSIIKAVPAEYRMIVYRRMMFRIADKIKEQEGAEALVTGDSLGQVASQTLTNMRSIYAATKSVVLHPLLGKDKREITDIAKEIGTFEISALPYEDCCSFMIAQHPVTKSKTEEIERYEKNLDVPKLVDAALTAAQIPQAAIQ